MPAPQRIHELVENFKGNFSYYRDEGVGCFAGALLDFIAQKGKLPGLLVLLR
jgi:hypothetical protein